MRITLHNKESFYDAPVRIKDLIEDKNKQYIAARVNHRLREMSYQFDYDATVQLLTLQDSEAVHVYENSLRYLIAMAFHNTYPELEIKFKYSISRSIFCYIINQYENNIEEILDVVQKEMDRLIELDIPFTRVTVSVDEAITFYKANNMQTRIDLIKYRPEETVHFYTCNDYINYMYGYMVASTGYLNQYKLRPYGIGFLIQYPRAEVGGIIPPFKDAQKYVKTLREASEWADVIDASTIAGINKHIEQNNIVDFVHMCEAKHNAMLTQLGDMIRLYRKDIRLIAIAGPSSSGKTTFSNRLRIELMTRGLRPVTISLDDYYLNREQMTPDENGEVDLEHINTLDIDLFNQNMLDLIEGKTVQIPVFDFHSKSRSGYRDLTISNDNPIIIEGIHALNEKLTSLVPEQQKFNIFISPQLQLNLDDHNPISITNLRLLRRIVRDKKFRNASALRTIKMWDSVRKGEFRWIYPHQERADFVYNSGLQYELCVLKKYALPTLQEIPNDSEHFITANRLIKFLKYFVDMEDSVVPNNSLLREFIGGSCFAETE